MYLLTCSLALYFPFYIFHLAAAYIELKEPGSCAANAYLMEKWKICHTFHDVDKDGFLSLEEFEKANYRQQFEKQGLLPVQIDQTVSILRTLWDKMVLNGNFKVSKDEYVEMLKARYESDPTHFIMAMQADIRDWFVQIDVNQDNLLTKEEYIKDLYAYEHKDNTSDVTFYMSHRLIKGIVPLAEAVEVWTRFLTENDESKPDIVYAAIQACS